jgi:hypothetical protein
VIEGAKQEQQVIEAGQALRRRSQARLDVVAPAELVEQTTADGAVNGGPSVHVPLYHRFVSRSQATGGPCQSPARARVNNRFATRARWRTLPASNLKEATVAQLVVPILALAAACGSSLIVSATQGTSVLARKTLANADLKAASARYEVDLGCAAGHAADVRAFLDRRANLFS